ncbi:MAG: protein TolR [Gammaproteobacteria bacterium]|nr:protein TolR [Gammaproteobacteria bacterium]NVK87048.1 protein TolR [Gammaproteobacteria bacterium]
MKPNRRKPMAEINVVPYIDVMLVLLVIFMITAPLITTGIEVELPEASSEPLPVDEEPPLIVSIDASGNYYLSLGEVQDQALQPQELVALVVKHRETHPKAGIVINADKKAFHGTVVKVMVLLQQEAGISDVGFATEPLE